MDFQQEMLGRTRKKPFFIFRTHSLLPEIKEKKNTFLEMGADGGLAKREVSSGNDSEKNGFTKVSFFLGNPGCGFVSCELGLVPIESKPPSPLVFPYLGGGKFSVSR